MSPAFDRALAVTLGEEGGLVDNPLDRGGATNRGITQRTYDAYRSTHGLAKRSVALLEDAELRVIYHDDYWQAINGDALPEPVAAAVFDMAVSSGTWNAKIALQRAARTRTDGVIGPTTLLAVKSTPEIVLRFLKQRAALIQEIVATRPSQVAFLEGWINRLLDQAWKGAKT